MGVEMDTFMAAGRDTRASGKWEKGGRGLGPGGVRVEMDLFQPHITLLSVLPRIGDEWYLIFKL